MKSSNSETLPLVAVTRIIQLPAEKNSDNVDAIPYPQKSLYLHFSANFYISNNIVPVLEAIHI